MPLATFRKDGTEVRPGDVITDFRGRQAEFVMAIRAPEGHRTGKIIFREGYYTAADAVRLNWARAGAPIEGECYMGVFDLDVRVVPVAVAAPA